MARHNANSLLNSLKGKIWIATGALAFFVCTFGLVSYLIISFVVNDPLYAVFLPFLFLALTMLVFGWWLSNEITSPIEKVTLLAKSLERSASTSLPKTSGSTETDELLETLHRNSLQMQKLVNLMDEVAAGKTDVALTPLQSSDRLVSSFQRLLGKITDSIDAKQKLEKLETAVEKISDEIARVRHGNLDAEISSDVRETREISETLKFLLNNLSDIVSEVRSNSRRTQSAAAEVRKTLQNLIQQDENKIQEMNQAAFTLGEIPGNVQKIAENFSTAVSSATQSIEKARKGTKIAQENLQSVASLRKQLQEAISRVGRLEERSQEISKISKTIGDLAHRTNMIALNALIQADDSGEGVRGFSVVSTEIERLARRAEETNKQISSLNKSITVEISEVERSLKSTIADAADLSRFALETGNSLSELEKHIAQFLTLQEQLNNDSQLQAVETEKAFQIFVGSIAETEMAVDSLRQSEKSVAALVTVLDNLKLSVTQFKLTSAEREETFGEPDFALPNLGGETGDVSGKQANFSDYPPAETPELILQNTDEA